MKVIFRLLFVFIFIFSAIYVFKHQKYSKRIEIINGYAENFSVNRGDDLSFYLNAQVDHKKGVVAIYNVGNQIVDSLVLDLIAQAPQTDTLLYVQGYNYINKYSYNTSKLKSGLYLLGNVVPFIVKEPNLQNAITVVFPYANFMALSNEGGKSFDAGNSSYGLPAEELSLKRSVQFRNNPLFLINWIDSTFQHQSINYISDLDLEKSDNLEHSKLLILYGYLSFWSSSQRKSFDNFTEKGGNVLAICSNLMNNKFRYNAATNSIHFRVMKKDEIAKDPESALGLWNRIQTNITSIACSYEIGYPTNTLKSSLGGFKVIKPIHPIFNLVKDSLIGLNNENSNSIAVENINFVTYPVAFNDTVKFFSKEILAYDYSNHNNNQTVTGIFLMQKTPTSGKLLIIGNEKWCWKNNFNKTTIRLITKNCIDYLGS